MNKYQASTDSYLYTLVLLFLLPIILFSTTISAGEPSDYNITSPISGIVQKIYIKKGQSVKKGDLLLEFDDSLIESDLAEAKANMNLASIKLAEAKKEQSRAEELYDITVLSEHERQQAKVLYQAAIAHYAQSKNQHLHAQWEMQHSKLYAGFAGQITQVLTYPGQYINNQLTAQVLLIIKK